MSNDGHEAYPRYPSYTAHPYQLNDDAAAVPTSGPSSSSSSSSSLGAPLRQSNEQQVLPMLPTGLAPVPLAVPPQIQPGAVINGASGAAAGRVRSAIACALCRKQKMKCEGPELAPCKRCRNSKVPCVFEQTAEGKGKEEASMELEHRTLDLERRLAALESDKVATLELRIAFLEGELAAMRAQRSNTTEAGYPAHSSAPIVVETDGGRREFNGRHALVGSGALYGTRNWTTDPATTYGPFADQGIQQSAAHQTQPQHQQHMLPQHRTSSTVNSAHFAPNELLARVYPRPASYLTPDAKTPPPQATSSISHLLSGEWHRSDKKSSRRHEEDDSARTKLRRVERDSEQLQ